MRVIRCAVERSFAYQPPMQLKKRNVSETGQGYSLWSEELQFTFVNCLQIIHKFKHEHEEEYSLHVVEAIGPLTMSCTDVSQV